MNLEGYEMMECGRGKFLKNRSEVISVNGTSGWIGFGKGVVLGYNLQNQERCDVFVKRLQEKVFSLVFKFSKDGQYKIIRGNSLGLSIKALQQKYPGIGGEYRITGAENGTEGLFFLCEKKI